MARIQRPRYRKHRRHSRGLAAFLAAMAVKWSGEENEIAVNAVGSDVLAIASDQGVAGPFTLRGAPPPELRNVPRFWVANDGSENLTIYQSRQEMANDAGLAIDTWSLELDFDSLSAVVKTSDVLSVGTTVAAQTTLGTVVAPATLFAFDSLGTPVAVTAVSAGDNTLTMVGHGYLVGDGPFYVASTGDIPAGLAATTPYWIQAKTDDTVVLAASLGGGAIDITDAGTANITFVPVNVDLSLETMRAIAHGLATGDGPLYTSTGTTLPTGLAATTPYWAIRTSADLFKLAASKADALALTAINLTGIGAGTQTVKAVKVDVSLDTLEITAHGLVTGDGPIRIATDTTLPAGSAAATDYWVNRVSADRFALALTKANAIDGVVVNLTTIGAGIQTVSLVNVDTTLESFHKVAHGLATGQLVRLTTDGGLPTGVAVTTNYWVIRVDADHFQLAANLADSGTGTPISFTAVGSGTTTVWVCNVDTTTDVLTFATAHGLVTGDGPVRLTTNGALPTGLGTGIDYWIIRLSATTLQLAATLANAVAGSPTPVNITAIGSGTTTVTLSGVDVTIEVLRAVGHAMETGDGPVECVTNGTLPAGLVVSTPYYVIKVDADHFALAETYDDAIAGTKINMTDIGSGDHGLSRALYIGKDLSADGLLEWLAQGVARGAMQTADVADVDTIFV